MYQILVALTLFLLITTLLPLWRHTAWWVRGFDFPRFQFMLLSLLVLLAGILFLDFSNYNAWIIAGIALGSTCLHGGWILPYTTLFPVEVKASRQKNPLCSIRLITANVLTTNRNYKGLLEIVQHYKPDILVTLETDLWWEEQLSVLEKEYTQTIKCPQDNRYGMHVYSKLSLEDTAIQFLVEPDVPSMHASVALRSGTRVRIHFLHPAPPSPTENLQSSERDAELLVVAKSVSDELSPIIVTGDLNDVAWSATTRLFRKISGLLDPRIGRGMFNTFHAEFWFARWPLDHLFHSEHFTLTTIKRLPYFGSDHFPMMVELMLDETHGADQLGLQSEEEDYEWAERKLKENDIEEKDVHEPGKTGKV